jgi:hypothetical protein
VSKKRESHKQALRQLLDRFGVAEGRLSITDRTREQLIDEILRVGDRFDYNPSFDEALNSGDGTYKP